VDFLDGFYTYHCDMHTNLSATFPVGNAPALPVPAPAPAPAPLPITVPPPVSTSPVVTATKSALSTGTGTLKVTLTANDVLTVTKSGKAVKSLPRGTYNIVISDKSAKRDLTLRRIGGSNSLLTSKGFTGTRTVNVDLDPGQWKIFSAANEGGIFSFFRVTKS
jgi:hypothetical protein